MSFDRNGDLIARPRPVQETKPTCTLCRRELTTVGVGGVRYLSCPLHGSRGVPR